MRSPSACRRSALTGRVVFDPGPRAAPDRPVSRPFCEWLSWPGRGSISAAWTNERTVSSGYGLFLGENPVLRDACTVCTATGRCLSESAGGDSKAVRHGRGRNRLSVGPGGCRSNGGTFRPRGLSALLRGRKCLARERFLPLPSGTSLAIRLLVCQNVTSKPSFPVDSFFQSVTVSGVRFSFPWSVLVEDKR